MHREKEEGTITCDIVRSSDLVTQQFVVPITVLGVARPSFRLICVLSEGDDPGSNDLTFCSPTLTTNGNSTIVIIGGDCATCAQPPFHESSVVSIGGVAMATKIVENSGGTRIITRTPRIDELGPEFDFTYYTLNITTPLGPHGVRSGAVLFGPLAPTFIPSTDVGGALTTTGQGSVADADRAMLECAATDHCPNIAPLKSGIFYTSICQGFRDQTKDMSWNVTASASHFAYGIPPNCIRCPVGCRCPGGARCTTEPGFFLPEGVEVLKDEFVKGPLSCHPDVIIARERCGGRSECHIGYEGTLCAKCATGYYLVNGGLCNVCPSEGDTKTVIIAIGLAFLLITTVAFTIVAVVQLSFGRGVFMGAVRSFRYVTLSFFTTSSTPHIPYLSVFCLIVSLLIRFAGWIVGALATQAQIGRTASPNQPKLLKDWYAFLRIFEMNPDGARPSECSGSTSRIAISAMSVSLGCALGFAFFGIPIINKWLIKLVNLIADSVTSLLAKLKKTKETDGEDGDGTHGGSEGDGTGEQTAAAVARDNDASTSAVLGMSASVRANPMLWKASTKTNSEKTEIEMTGFGGIAAAGVLTAVEGEGGGGESVVWAGKKKHPPHLREKEAMRTEVRRYREDLLNAESAKIAAAAAEKKGCCGKKKKKKKKKKISKKKTNFGGIGIGYLRSGMAGGFLFNEVQEHALYYISLTYHSVNPHFPRYGDGLASTCCERCVPFRVLRFVAYEDEIRATGVCTRDGLFSGMF